jgi:hypothetical protein
MPYSRKTTRRISRHVITLDALTRANWQVTSEMDTLGLWCPRLENVDVCLVPVAFDCYGWFLPDGHIHIPSVNLAQLSDFFQGQHTRLTDDLLHHTPPDTRRAYSYDELQRTLEACIRLELRRQNHSPEEIEADVARFG